MAVSAANGSGSARHTAAPNARMAMPRRASARAAVALAVVKPCAGAGMRHFPVAARAYCSQRDVGLRSSMASLTRVHESRWAPIAPCRLAGFVVKVYHNLRHCARPAHHKCTCPQTPNDPTIGRSPGRLAAGHYHSSLTIRQQDRPTVRTYDAILFLPSRPSANGPPRGHYWQGRSGICSRLVRPAAVRVARAQCAALLVHARSPALG